MITMQAAPAMKSYMIDLPHHVLRFSLPEEIAKEMTPLQVEKRFDPNEPGVFEGGFRQIAFHLHDFKGPFWVGAYGSLRFQFMVQKKNPEFGRDIAAVEGLERYVRHSLPLDGEIFLDAGFNVMAWDGGRGKESKWKAKAEALREEIKATVVLEPKPTAAPTSLRGQVGSHRRRGRDVTWQQPAVIGILNDF